MIQSYQEIGATGDGTVRYVTLCRDKNVSGKYYYPVGGSYVGLIGAIMSDGKGKVIGNELTLTGDVEAEVVMMDQFVYNGSNYLASIIRRPTPDLFGRRLSGRTVYAGEKILRPLPPLRGKPCWQVNLQLLRTGI